MTLIMVPTLSDYRLKNSFMFIGLISLAEQIHYNVSDF